jgi:hypothetical protein
MSYDAAVMNGEWWHFVSYSAKIFLEKLLNTTRIFWPECQTPFPVRHRLHTEDFTEIKFTIIE